MALRCYNKQVITNIQRNTLMSKIGNYVVEMQEDAYYMTLAQFTRKYGTSSETVWNECQIDAEPMYEIDDGA